MIKLMLVDDEMIERQSLKDFIPWQQMGIEVVAEAADGYQALRRAKEAMPDLIVSDIKMPGMNGIEFVEQIRNALPDVKVIFISGYQDFEYAKNAVMHGVFGYVLKPVDTKELVAVVQKAVHVLHEELTQISEKEKLKNQIKETLPLLQQQFLGELLANSRSYTEEALWQRAGYLHAGFAKGNFCVAVVQLDEYKIKEANITEEDKQLLNAGIITCLGETGFRNSAASFLRVKDYTCAVIINAPDRETDLIGIIEEAFEDFRSRFKKILNETATIGVSSVSGNITSIQLLYTQASTAVSHKWSLGKDQIIRYSDILPDHSKRDVEFDFREDIKEVIRLVLAGDSESVQRNTERLFEKMAAIGANTPLHVQNICITMVSECERQLIELGENPEDVMGNHVSTIEKLLYMDTMSAHEMFLKQLFTGVSNHVADKRGSKNIRLVERIIHIILRNYSRDISIEDISREVFFSPNYIRRVFKDETGNTLSEYILRVRMNKAMELMKDPSLHIYDIARKVGYDSVSYFCQMFKQKCGVSPKEYMDSLS